MTASCPRGCIRDPNLGQEYVQVDNRVIMRRAGGMEANPNFHREDANIYFVPVCTGCRISASAQVKTPLGRFHLTSCYLLPSIMVSATIKVYKLDHCNMIYGSLLCPSHTRSTLRSTVSRGGRESSSRQDYSSGVLWIMLSRPLN
jgi:hypothetical protein